MKRLLLFVLSFVFLAGCSKSGSITPIVSNISFTAKIDYNGNAFVCECDIKDSDFDLTVLEPEKINGLSYSLSNNQITEEFCGVSNSKSVDEFSDNSVIVVLYTVFNRINGAKTGVNDDGNYNITGTADNYEFKFVFSPSGLPVTLQVLDLNLKVDFNNVTLKP